MQCVIILARVLVISLALCGSVGAQIRIGTVTGSVTDHKGTALPGVMLVLNNPITGYQKASTTDEQGKFAFNNVPFDPYVLHVEATGFQSVVRDVNVRTNIPIHMEISLIVAGPNDSVTVEATGSLLEAGQMPFVDYHRPSRGDRPRRRPSSTGSRYWCS